MAKSFGSQVNRSLDTAKTLGTLLGTAATRGWLYALILGSEATPADTALLWIIQRCTTAGTAGASVTPAADDLADPAAVCIVGENHSAEPTYTAGAIPLAIPANQRSSINWVAVPGREIVVPATANAGVGILTPTGTAATAITATIRHFE